MSGWYSSTVNCYTVTHKSIHQFPTNLHQPSPTFAGLAKGSAQTLQLTMSVFPQIHADRRQVDQLSSYTTLFLFADWVNCRQFIHEFYGHIGMVYYWIYPHQKRITSKTTAHLDFCWIIGSLDHIPEGSLVQVTWSISGAGVPIMNQKNWAKCPNQTNKLGFSITSPTPFFQSQPHGRDLEKIPLNSLDGTVGSPLGTLFSRKMVMTARNCGSTCFWKMKYMTSNPKTKNKSSCSIQTKTTESTAGGIPSTCKLSIGEKKRKNVTADPLLNSVLGEFCSCSTDAEMDVEPGAHASPRHRHRSMASRPWIIPARRSGGS